ncbi:hypothetical protein R5W23_005902 [Gemmata sp. JC673]|uniref:Uncharacterized protein n=1 Tax=Gemmata algarum TaxID=2975278 RepID=A0ABU5EU64_9BACT|nr:hypothetical protein [Gemmata algarum]MDY3558745.1 hypothetical protein [Gemmata algarum]
MLIILASGVINAVRAEDKDATTTVTETAITPKDVESFGSRVVELRLSGINKQLADRSADLIEKIELKDFSHVTGKETKKAFTVGAKGGSDPKVAITSLRSCDTATSGPLSGRRTTLRSGSTRC